MGLPGSGKTTLAKTLSDKISARWINADDIRQQHSDWDFSRKGRIRQATRMRKLADQSSQQYVICDFVAPLQEMRDIFAADFTIWVDTIEKSHYADTNKMFEPPTKFNIRVTTQNAEVWADVIEKILDTINI